MLFFGVCFFLYSIPEYYLQWPPRLRYLFHVVQTQIIELPTLDRVKKFKHFSQKKNTKSTAEERNSEQPDFKCLTT